MPNPSGRPLKFNADIAQRILDGVTAGLYVEAVAVAAGINKDTLYRWLRAGARARDRRAAGQPLTQKDTVLAEFSDAFQKTLQDSERRAVLAIQVHGKEQWQALAWWLERRFPDRWGRRRLEVTGADGGPVMSTQVTVFRLPDNHRALPPAEEE